MSCRCLFSRKCRAGTFCLTPSYRSRPVELLLGAISETLWKLCTHGGPDLWATPLVECSSTRIPLGARADERLKQILKALWGEELPAAWYSRMLYKHLLFIREDFPKLSGHQDHFGLARTTDTSWDACPHRRVLHKVHQTISSTLDPRAGT